MSRTPVIIDTDPGIDDAAAICCALFSPELDVRLITTVAGNVGVEATTTNALKLLTFLGKRVPVAKGAEGPLAGGHAAVRGFHGATGLDGWDFDEPNVSLLLSESAEAAMYRVICSSESPITLVTLAPLTNVGRLFSNHPEVVGRIKRIVCMGGPGLGANATSITEFNISTDPEAANIVFSSGVPLAMAGLDMGWAASFTQADLEQLCALNQSGAMLSSILRQYRSRSRGRLSGVATYDVHAVACLLKPELYECQPCHVSAGVERAERGRLTAASTGEDEANAFVCTSVNAEGFKEWFFSTIYRCP